MFLKEKRKLFLGSFEETISMFLGLLIVVVSIGLIFNFVKNQKGNVNIPGVSTNISINENDLNITQNDESSKKIYEVVYGDNLWKIAEKQYGSGYAWVNIAKENNLKNPGIIKVGQKLNLPKIEDKDIAINKDKQVIQSGEYVVVKGDCLWKIAVRTYGDGFQWVKIWENNKDILVNPSKIEIGTKLILPNLSG